jgi:hypothetical protein
MAAYMSSLVMSFQDNYPHINVDDNLSLLTRTLLEIVNSWTNPTKILVRTYQHNKYISCALLVFFRYALQNDTKNLSKHASKIQSMIVNSIPMYLNRASQEQRNLACCVCELILPRLRDMMTNKQANLAKSDEYEDIKLNFKADLDDDLLYLQRVFNNDVEVLFQDVSDMKIEANKTGALTIGLSDVIPDFAASDHDANNDRVNSCRLDDKQLQEKTNALNIDDDDDKTTACCSSSNGSELVDSINRKCAGKAGRVQICDEENGDDLIPYSISEDEDDDTDGEFELGNDAINVPIYLRDCISGLIENTNHRYVRLCLIKAIALIDEMIEQDDADAKKSESVCLAARSGKPSSVATAKRDSVGDGLTTRHDSSVNDTIKDVGIELARTLLFIENQFNIEKFDEHRISGLVSLCFAAPGLVGKYLVDELNESNRSMRQQLDILHILVASAHRLAFNTKLNNAEVQQLTSSNEQLVVSSRRRSTKKSVNKFAPFASLYFYGISYRLKADVLDSRSLIISQPQSIMSAFREHHNKDIDVFKINSNSKSGIIFNATLPIPSKQSNCKLIWSDEDDYEKDCNQTNKSLVRDSISDDSYLLSRILLSIANILSCSAQQPVTCKLSSDLLDILSAYRCHPDSGVQRALVGCLIMIRDCTPGTYYSEYIEKRMMRSFGAWLAKNEPNIKR